MAATLCGIILVGARGYDRTGTPDIGTAYIFDRSAGVFTQTAQLVTSDGNSFDELGNKVSLSGDRALAVKVGKSVAFSDVGNETQTFEAAGAMRRRRSAR